MNALNTINHLGEVVLRTQSIGEDLLYMFDDELQIFLDEVVDCEDFSDIASCKNAYLLDKISFEKIRKLISSKPKILDETDALEYIFYKLTQLSLELPNGLIFYKLDYLAQGMFSFSYMCVRNPVVTRRFYITMALKSLDE